MNPNMVERIYGRSSIKKDCSFRPNPFTNMATTGNSCCWLVGFYKKSTPLKPSSEMNRNLVGSPYGFSKQKERWVTQDQPTESLVSDYFRKKFSCHFFWFFQKELFMLFMSDKNIQITINTQENELSKFSNMLISCHL